MLRKYGRKLSRTAEPFSTRDKEPKWPSGCVSVCVKRRLSLRRDPHVKRYLPDEAESLQFRDKISFLGTELPNRHNCMKNRKQ